MVERAERPDTTSAGEESTTEQHPVRRPYSSPRLEVLGDIRDITLGGSAGNLDSGNQFVEKPL